MHECSRSKERDMGNYMKILKAREKQNTAKIILMSCWSLILYPHSQICCRVHRQRSSLSENQNTAHLGSQCAIQVLCKNKKHGLFHNSQRGGGLDIPSKTLLDLLQIKIKLWCKPPRSPQGIWSCQSQSAEEQILALLLASFASSRVAISWASTHYSTGRLCLNWAAKQVGKQKQNALQGLAETPGSAGKTSLGHFRALISLGFNRICHLLCRHTSHILNHQRKAGFYQWHPTLPKPAWESSTHTHTPRCQFRMAQAVKKSVQSNEHHLEQWEPVSFLYFAHAMLSFPRNSKLSLHANAIFPVLLPGANWVFPQPGALHKDVMEWESYCTTRAYSTGSSMQCNRACIRSGLHKEK